jgi:hypothetical protein
VLCHVGSKAYCLLEILLEEELDVTRNPRRNAIVLILEFKEAETPWLGRERFGLVHHWQSKAKALRLKLKILYAKRCIKW